MKRQLELRRPLAFMDLETTGRSTLSDRIVEIGILKIMPNGRMHKFHAKLDPERPIRADASRIHGITNKQVEGNRTFKDVARRVFELLADSDVAGFNIAAFDLLLLQEEFRRVGMEFSLLNRLVVDVMRIYHKKEPRNLASAYRFYCGSEHSNAHHAFEDARVSWKVLEGQLDRYADLPNTAEGLCQFCRPAEKPQFVDSGRWFELKDGEPFFVRGKHARRSLRAVAKTDPDYLDWMLGEDIADDTALLVARALRK